MSWSKCCTSSIYDHNYDRIYPIKFNPNSPSELTEITTNTYATYTDNDRQIFATVGTGGVSLYTFAGKEDYLVSSIKLLGS
jgi:hypothetical protein